MRSYSDSNKEQVGGLESLSDQNSQRLEETADRKDQPLTFIYKSRLHILSYNY